ncbi:unnamed protein product [Symbiodinium necroappetens]|uniref:Uncharacterized protein n=1 Tax=Symbiodinium necroappetens TaxID=1628268 RepID=A0A812T6N5_9DINO|nr:unnamed protein product [Symbiodinium necroappetens]
MQVNFDKSEAVLLLRGKAAAGLKKRFVKWHRDKYVLVLGTDGFTGREVRLFKACVVPALLYGVIGIGVTAASLFSSLERAVFSPVAVLRHLIQGKQCALAIDGHQSPELRAPAQNRLQEIVLELDRVGPVLHLDMLMFTRQTLFDWASMERDITGGRCPRLKKAAAEGKSMEQVMQQVQQEETDSPPKPPSTASQLAPTPRSIPSQLLSCTLASLREHAQEIAKFQYQCILRAQIIKAKGHMKTHWQTIHIEAWASSQQDATSGARSMRATFLRYWQFGNYMLQDCWNRYFLQGANRDHGGQRENVVKDDNKNSATRSKEAPPQQTMMSGSEGPALASVNQVNGVSEETENAAILRVRWTPYLEDCDLYVQRDVAEFTDFVLSKVFFTMATLLTPDITVRYSECNRHGGSRMMECQRCPVNRMCSYDVDCTQSGSKEDEELRIWSAFKQAAPSEITGEGADALDKDRAQKFHKPEGKGDTRGADQSKNQGGWGSNKWGNWKNEEEIDLATLKMMVSQLARLCLRHEDSINMWRAESSFVLFCTHRNSGQPCQPCASPFRCQSSPAEA